MGAFKAGGVDALSYVDPENYLLLKDGSAVADRKRSHTTGQSAREVERDQEKGKYR